MLDGADDDASLWSVCSTELGNSVIGIRKDRGLVGKAVTLVEDVTIDDAYSDPAFNQRVDKATSFLRRPGRRGNSHPRASEQHATCPSPQRKTRPRSASPRR